MLATVREKSPQMSTKNPVVLLHLRSCLVPRLGVELAELSETFKTVMCLGSSQECMPRDPLDRKSVCENE